MPHCCDCHITRQIFDRFWSFWFEAADRLSNVILLTLFFGSVASAIYFNFETSRLGSQLCKIAECHEKAEEENRKLRKRTLALWKERSRMSDHLARIEAANERTDAQLRRLKHKDSVGRAELAALCGDLKNLKKSLAGAYRERDLYREKLECFVSQGDYCNLRPLTK